MRSHVAFWSNGNFKEMTTGIIFKALKFSENIVYIELIFWPDIYKLAKAIKGAFNPQSNFKKKVYAELGIRLSKEFKGICFQVNDATITIASENANIDEICKMYIYSMQEKSKESEIIKLQAELDK